MKIKTMEMIRKIRENHYNVVKNKSNDEIISFFRKKAKQLENKEKVSTGNFVQQD